jgi:pimeloyl-ACP methyl ester carboxylesterase
MKLVRWTGVLCLLFPVAVVRADGPGDNKTESARPVPPPGVKLPEELKQSLTEGLAALQKDLDALPAALKSKPALLDLIPDVEIFHKAVRYALAYDEFFDLKEAKFALEKLIPEGRERAKQLLGGKAPWTTATGPQVRAYRSKIDGSVQPYGLLVPASYKPESSTRHRLDVWLHGRGEKLSEVNFIGGVMKGGGPFQPKDAFVLQSYGRYCNAFKLAGESDVLEELAHARKSYPIDEDRLVIRGFSMGGAGCWHLAAHHPTLWAAAAPGAGFSETEQFLKVFQKEIIHPTPSEKKLLQYYDCPVYSVNFYNLPTVAYSGEVDSQKQAADVMQAALKNVGIEMIHLIGPKTGHAYHPVTKVELERRIDELVRKGRDRVPTRIRFATPTLRFNRSAWVRVDGLEEQWKPCDVTATLHGHTITVTAPGVTDLTLKFGPGDAPLELADPVVKIDGNAVSGKLTGLFHSDRSWSASFHKGDSGWTLVTKPEEGLRKRHGLQGPIDDAFLGNFVMVRPTGTAMHETADGWAKKEMTHAIKEWRKQFRGDAIVKDDKDITEADIASSNLILWGDPGSNSVLAKVAKSLPILWEKDTLKVGAQTFDPKDHAPVLIYPNPLNPKRYIVVNSGFTYREYAYLNNARQVPMLPDYAVIDLRTPPGVVYPGKIATEGFFDEKWQVK